MLDSEMSDTGNSQQNFEPMQNFNSENAWGLAEICVIHPKCDEKTNLLFRPSAHTPSTSRHLFNTTKFYIIVNETREKKSTVG